MKQLLIGVMALFMLLVSGWGQQAAAGTSLVDHYKCYKVKGEKFDPKPLVEVEDQFELDTDTVVKPALVCNPADKNEEGIHFPGVHQVCYKVKGQEKLPPVTVRVTNQFGTQDLKVKKKEKFLCVPSNKNCIGDGGEPVACPNEEPK